MRRALRRDRASDKQRLSLCNNRAGRRFQKHRQSNLTRDGIAPVVVRIQAKHGVQGPHSQFQMLFSNDH